MPLVWLVWFVAAMVAICVLRLGWFLFTWWVGRPQEMRTVLRRLEPAIRAGEDIADVLEALSPLVSRPYMRRARVAADALRTGVVPTIADALGRARILDPDRRRIARACERRSPALLADWCRLESRCRPFWDRLIAALSIYIAVTLAMALMLNFIAIFIVPKLQKVIEEIGVEPSASFALVVVVAAWYTPILLVLAAGVLLGVVFNRVAPARWRPCGRGARKLRCGELLQCALARGLAEADLADLVAEMDGSSPTLIDRRLPDLIRGCGWRSHTVDAFAKEVDGARRGRIRREHALIYGAKVSAPLALGSLVLLIGHAWFSTLIVIIDELGRL